MQTATIIGSGPNGLSAAIVLAAAGIATTVLERNNQIGGACSTAETTLPNFRQDLGSSAYPMGVASPFFRSLPINIPWIEPTAPCAHPLDDGTAVMLEHSIEATVDTLDECDQSSYRSLIAPLASEFAELSEDILGPIQHIPRHPLVLARFGSSALLSAASLARSRFAGTRARALLAGMATHSVLSLAAPASAAVALTLMAAGHALGWPILRGGAQTLPDALARHLQDLGGHIETNHEVVELPQSGLVLANITPRQLLRIAGSQLPPHYCKLLERFRYGAGAFKIDYALRAPIPWTAPECSRAATVHIGGSLEEIVESERTFTSARPFVLLGQPSLFDPSRAPAGQHTAWAYCHVPNGSTRDCTECIENQITRFAPDFRDCILARSVSSPAALERWNPNLIGGDFLGGVMDIRQILFRPTRLLYRTPLSHLFLCGASTPPGGGVHGMAGYHAAKTALRSLNR
ncbi:NAD(P)/FAD-dependent oxidoreductase [Alloacidobacterium dinghuense]|uniref:Pyridine nucleotide-disulfide oxidoreductase domain-containing protein 2 n=1 Tax=Alloacidobacterium dinghuense TaxID=2763107 RepID=A0A7G8BJN2_9BACT|nr:NAD(P)/FAD-dependent oxidoreductase [Alloacidobacterium dinghuense]QNI32752.1 NAD(P)/FAD-dependent oxidoreductase [Alloacidobacterium dinghuense]